MEKQRWSGSQRQTRRQCDKDRGKKNRLITHQGEEHNVKQVKSIHLIALMRAGRRTKEGSERQQKSHAGFRHGHNSEMLLLVLLLHTNNVDFRSNNQCRPLNQGEMKSEAQQCYICLMFLRLGWKYFRVNDLKSTNITNMTSFEMLHRPLLLLPSGAACLWLFL